MKMRDFISNFSSPLNNLYSKKNLKFWVLGLFAFLWFIVRSGSNPKRIAYPCQQAAFPLAYAWIIAMISIFSGVSFVSILSKAGKTVAVLFIVGMIFISATDKNLGATLNPDELPVWQSSNPVSEIFLLKTFEEKDASLAAGDASVPNDRLSDPAMDNLIDIISTNGTNFYQSGSGAGLVSASDVVIIKGNFQWEYTLGTNTDRIKGLIWRILEHPDGFDGEILVCDNDQGVRNWTSCNNSYDTQQTIIDVVNTFKAKGYPVDLMEWDQIMNNTVNEYTDGDMANGFTYNSTTKVSYPKFQTPAGNYVSLKHGIYNAGSYDREKMCLINFAVCKAHGYSGATLAIKNWVGAMSLIDKNSRYGSEDIMHLDYFLKEFALPARVMAESYPDLNIIDATWTAPNDNYTNSSGNRVNTKVLLASTDPVASSWYAAKYILNPIASNDNRTNPDYVEPDPGSIGLYSYRYSMALANWESYLKNNTDFNITRNSNEISVYDRTDALNLITSKIQDFEIMYVPIDKTIYIDADNNAPIEDLYFSVVSLEGKVLVNKTMKTNNIIHLNDLPEGIYIVRYILNKDLTLVKKIII